ncbi:MAG: S8 family serine peptidase [Caldilineales bacterium]
MKPSKPRLATLLPVVLLLASLGASCVMPVPPNETPMPGATWTPEPVATETPGPISGDPDEIQAYCSAYSKDGKSFQEATPEPSMGPAERAGLTAEEMPSVEQLPRMVRPPFLNLMYVDGQILLTGEQSAIDKVAEEFNLDFAYAEYDPISLGEGRSIRLAEIPEGRSVEEVSCLFEQFVLANPDLDAAADPNYFMSPAWRGGGSPWTQNGYWASNQPGGGLGTASAEQFLKQWALSEDGIGLMRDGERVVDATGEGVTIAVLDTSPWRAPCLGRGPCSKPWEVKWSANLASGDPISETMNLITWDMGPANPKTCPGKDGWNEKLNRERQDISNHGLFVASLAHQVAPQSTMHLLRVLEDDGCGDMFKVLQGLQQFEDYMTAASQGGVVGGNMPLNNTVVNLSLGVHLPDNPENVGLPKVVTALNDKLNHMTSLGAVVVAAAGNDSYSADPSAQDATDPAAPLPGEIPAVESQVIGVAASTYDRQRGCFSNIGDVAAPGGNGLMLSPVPKDPTLTAAAVAGDYVNCIVPGRVDRSSRDFWCEQAGNENYCLIGLGVDPSNTSETTFLYWVGTSFATPLVSGMAALKLQEGVPPDQVDDAIYASADSAAPVLGAGIVNLGN